MEDFAGLSTEQRNTLTTHLDTMSATEVAAVMNAEDHTIADAIAPHIPNIGKVAEAAAQSLANNGRLIYIGAGTSGRLGLLDAVECPPTFGTDPAQVVGVIAGGDQAFIAAQEGAEDSAGDGSEAIVQLAVTERDTVVGISASGRTPYVLGALGQAHRSGCVTAAISNNPHSPIGQAADIAIDVPVGPEVLSGSTRLKSGTAQKMILNMISTAAMVRAGKTFGNLMVDVKQTNEKLRNRAERIVCEATGVPQETAREALRNCNGSCKLAILTLLANCDAAQAAEVLEKAGGHVREALLTLAPTDTPPAGSATDNKGVK